MRNECDADPYDGSERNLPISPLPKKKGWVRLVIVLVTAAVYAGLVIMADLEQSLARAEFYEHLSQNTTNRPQCGNRIETHRVHTQYSNVLLLSRSPKINANASILNDGECLLLLLDALQDSRPGTYAVIGDQGLSTKAIAVTIHTH